MGANWSSSKEMLLDFPFSCQMANLAHRAGQLAEKQYLIVHPTADGKGAWRRVTS